VSGNQAKAYWSFKEHSRRKLRVLEKYLNACKRFADKYENFVYVDTHGGSGKVIGVAGEVVEESSPLIASKLLPTYPCHVVEVNPSRFKTLREATKDYPNITLYHGNCNALIDEILSKIPKGRVFVFFFTDPDGLIEEETHVHELLWTTVEKIATFPRTELLLNFPLEALWRTGGYVRKKPDALKWTPPYRDAITSFMPVEGWETRIKDFSDKQVWLDLYMGGLEPHYKYRGALLVLARQLPVYYLVYASNREPGPTIMRDIMKIEWEDQFGEKLSVLPPLEYFVFDDRLLRPRLL
jgi:three-Cys-motif partner protein